MNLNRFSKIENNKKNLKSGDLFFMCYLEMSVNKVTKYQIKSRRKILKI